MSIGSIDITGLGSVGPCGPVSGPLRGLAPAPTLVTAWPAAGPRYALRGAAFRMADVLPRVNTRRLDRLSAWSLAAAALALRDAGLDLSTVDGSRTAVVSATGFGCLSLTEAYLGSAYEHGWQQTDPINFPETLGNVPAAHVARVFGCLGPNVTVGSRGPAAENALLMAGSLLRSGQADRALVLAGDTLTRGLFDWYEVAGLLSADVGGFVPSEGVAAMVLEAAGRQRARARLLDTRWVQADGGERLQWDAASATVVAKAQSAPAGLLASLSPQARFAPACAIGDGLPDTGGLFRILTALGAVAPSSRLLVLGAARSGACAAVLLEAPAHD
ncbi:MAG: beta-ketoacyl synthase N-terminal-like domain-containing protein [Bryobacteraceae bacterium]